MRYKILLLLALLIPLIPATPILKLQDESIQPGETILATITTSGEFVEKIDKSQIKFFEGRKQITLESDILFYNNTHYLCIYTNQEKNITLKIENILYRESGTLQSKTITQNLTISKNTLINKETNETYTQILKIKPGFISPTRTPELKLTNAGTQIINITFDEEEIKIAPFSTYELKFIPKKTFSLTEISTYKNFLIPTIYLLPTKNLTFIPPVTKADLQQSPETLLVETFTDTKSQETIQLFNLGDENLTELKISMPTDFIETEALQNISARGTQNITLKLEPKNPGNFQGTINISYMQNGTQNILEIPTTILVLPKGEPEESFQVQEESCDQLSGQICEKGFLCNGTHTFTKKAEYCCLDSCVPINSEDTTSTGFGWIVALLILATLGFIGYYFYKKQKEMLSQKSKTPLSATTEKFEKRLYGNKSRRTTGKITKS